MYLELLKVCIILECCSSQFLYKPFPINYTLLLPYAIDARPTKLGEVPYQVSFKHRGIFINEYLTFCGGVLISSQKILTAAHCFDSGLGYIDSDCTGATKKVKRRNLMSYAVAGNIKNYSVPPTLIDSSANKTAYLTNSTLRYMGQWRSLACGVFPSKFRFPKLDIAVIWTHIPFEFSEFIYPIPVASVYEDYLNVTCVASGFGYLDNNTQGDSGGPLVCKETGDPNDKGDGVVAGIVCGYRKGVSSFFTRVSSYKHFIETATNAAENQKPICCSSEKTNNNTYFDHSIAVPRIYNGVPASLGDVPYQVSFKRRSSRKKPLYASFCGGTIIGRKKLLTAAHCFEEKSWFSSTCFSKIRKVPKTKLRDTWAVAGNLNNEVMHPSFSIKTDKTKAKDKGEEKDKKVKGEGKDKKDKGEEKDKKVKGEGKDKKDKGEGIDKDDKTKVNTMKLKYIDNDAYSGRRQESAGQWRSLESGIYPASYKFPKDDIAVIWTYTAFVYGPHVGSIPIAISLIDYDRTCLASGYGRTSPTTTSSVLLKANLDIIPIRACSRIHRKNMARFVCTSSAISDTGKGDSGGPLVCKGTADKNDKGNGVVVGVVSGNRQRAGTFFTRVSAYNWLWVLGCLSIVYLL